MIDTTEEKHDVTPDAKTVSCDARVVRLPNVNVVPNEPVVKGENR